MKRLRLTAFIMILCLLPGLSGGAALADILSGRASPSGRLTDTWARRYADVPCAMQYSFVWSEWCASSQAVYCPFDIGSCA